MTFKALVPGPLRLSLRHADGGRAHRQRHVRPDPGRAGRRPAARSITSSTSCRARSTPTRRSASTAARSSASTSCSNERPEYFVFNGSVGALSKLHPLQAKVGETVRIFFGVGGPNFTSSFHVIGEIFDKVYKLGGLISPPLHGMQTVTVPPGGAVIVEFKLDVPGN